MVSNSWTWDPSLYRGSAEFYAHGRIPYPRALADALSAELGLDGSGRLLDVGCGPGSLALLMAERFDEVIGLDADADMIDKATEFATASGARNTRWLHMRAEQLPAALGRFRLITLAQSFHWMDRPKVAACLHTMLDRNGMCAHVQATTHRGLPHADTHPVPPYPEIDELVREFLGPIRRAGRGLLPAGTPSGEEQIYQQAGFTRVRRMDVPGREVTRTVDDLVAAVFSLSSSTPHLFGDHRSHFESRLRTLLKDATPDGLFRERTREIAIDLWQP
ncbi:class I SAM-dependent methyltransferase [Nocardia jejuensis]|uniref:class I SAM-dependent methyltransferase n=1 Tax=Nocardia jejuensis TaxID=328049 RepID=UPI001C3F8DB9|nr:class I SAM-dependent methyltransferase [Nocardia jejuensis]